MCGIIGYIGQREANDILVSGLERLEYRGYDSAGVCTDSGDFEIFKAKGRVEKVKGKILKGNIGIAHTRWSTHGAPSDKNAHPFVDHTGEFSLVHNGIIENYLEIKEELRNQGVTFTSDTDSEVIVHLISSLYQGDLMQAVQKTIQRLQGAYAFCVIKKGTKEMIGARNGSPLVVGLGDQEFFLASDVSAVIEHTKRVIYLNDFEIARLDDNCTIHDFQGNEKTLNVSLVQWDLQQAQKQGYKHFMLKEIFEQPKVIGESLQVNFSIEKPERIIVVACGTASYAGLVGKYIIEEVAKVPVNYEIASEFRYKEPLINPTDLVIAISQSGETADTLAAIRLAKQHGAKTLGFINVVDSTIAREVDQVVYTRAGPEIGVASTKAFISQLVAMYQLAYKLDGREFYGGDLATHVFSLLEQSERIKTIAQKYFLSTSFLYIGRNRNFPLALEGALKLKEISYIHAEAYPAGELKHGPIALVSEDMPTLAVCPKDSVYTKTFSNIEEIKARSGRVIAIATQGDTQIQTIADDVIYIPQVEETLYPFLATIPLQLLAYHIADLKDCDIDKPRNLAKSVTVE